MKKILPIFAALLFAGSTFADVVKFTFKTDTDITYIAEGTSSTGSLCEVSKSYVTLTSPSGYTTSKTTLTVYKNSSLTITAPGEITQIDLSYNGQVYPFTEASGGDSITDGKFAVSGAHAATYTPETPAKSITLTNPNNGKTELLSLAVTYTDAEIVHVTDIKLDQSSIDLIVSERTTLVATVSPENATLKGVLWSTSDAEVATVRVGEVVAMGAGEATITATCVDDNTITAICTVTVTEKSTPEGAVFFETFDQFTNGIGANDGIWSNIGTTPAAGTYDNEGWTAEGLVCAGYACASLRIAKDANGTAIPSGLTTPVIGKAGTGKVMFKAESWGTDVADFYVDIVGGGTFVADDNLAKDNISNNDTTAKVTMKKASTWTTFTLAFKDFTTSSKLRFYIPASKRAFLDEVAVFVTSGPTAIDNTTLGTHAVKSLENGQLIILRDGVKYNATGVRLQ